MNKKIVFGGLSALIIGLSVAGSAFAYQGDYTKKGPNYTPERETAMTEAMNQVDYAAWQKLMFGRGRVSQVINQDNFAKFAEAWKLGQAGNTAEAAAIRQELGLGNGFHKMSGGYGRNGTTNNSDQKGRGNNQTVIDSNNDGVCDNLQ
jgi:hypothetical protein